MTGSLERLVVRSADPVLAGRALLALEQHQLVVASDAAAQALGLPRAPLTLARLARRAARRHGRLAPAVTRRQTLRAACASVFAEEEAAGYANRGAAAVAAWLRAGLPAAAPAGLSERTARWWQVASRYQQALRAQGAIDPAEACRLVAADPPEPARLAVIGYPALDPDELLLLDALAGPGSLLVLPRDGSWTEAADASAAELVARGWHQRERDDPAPAAQVEAWRASTVGAEVRAALAQVKRLLHGAVREASEIAVVTREPERYADELRSVARSYGVPLRVERRVALRRTPLGAWLALLVEVLADDFPFEASAALLRHPFCGLLDQEAFDAARRWRPRGLAAWRRALSAGPQSERAKAALAALAPMASGRVRPRGVSAPGDAGGWRSALEHLLAVMLLPSARTACEVTLLAWQRALDDAVAPLAPSADTVAEPGSSDDDPDPAAAVSAGRASGMHRGVLLRAVRDVLRVVTVADAAPAAAADAAAVRVVTPEALAGARVPMVLLLGAAEGIFPAPVVDPPLFDAVDRQELRAAGVAVPLPADQARRERLAAWGVWRAAEHLWISYSEQTGRDARLPSAFLAELGARAAPLAMERPASPAERRARDLARPEVPDDDADPVLRAARYAWRVELGRERAPERDGFDGVLGSRFDAQGWRWSATQLTTFGQCRFRWLAQSVWGVREPLEGEVEVSPLLRGSLYHHALHAALKAAVGLRGEAARTAAAAALDAAFAAAERRTNVGAVPHWRHLRAEHLEHLRDLLRQPAFLADDHQVVLLETAFDDVWYGLRVIGRVDRIDRTPDGVMVIDYKTGAGRPLGARGFDPERLDLDLQLPLYLDVAAPRLMPGERVAGARYFSLGAMREIPREPPDPAETADFVARLRRTLAVGDYPVEPSDACRYCPLEAACRKGPRLEHKRSVPPADVAPGEWAR